MPTSIVLLAKRAPATVLLKLAVAYHSVLSINRDASEGPKALLGGMRDHALTAQGDFVFMPNALFEK